jgi:uncharacterized membrane protein
MRILWSGLILGLLLNFLGWIGNVFLLGPAWEAAFLSVPVTAWRGSPWRDVISLLPDFVYGIAICWAYAGLAPRYGRSVATALRATALVFAVGALTTYVGIANSGLLPWTLAAATTLLALVTFVPGAWLAHALMRNHGGPARATGAVTSERDAR